MEFPSNSALLSNVHILPKYLWHVRTAASSFLRVSSIKRSGIGSTLNQRWINPRLSRGVRQRECTRMAERAHVKILVGHPVRPHDVSLRIARQISLHSYAFCTGGAITWFLCDVILAGADGQTHRGKFARARAHTRETEREREREVTSIKRAHRCHFEAPDRKRHETSLDVTVAPAGRRMEKSRQGVSRSWEQYDRPRI